MLIATRELLVSDERSWNPRYERLVDVVVRHGSTADADALLTLFLDDPGRLRDGMPSGVLHAVGYLGYEPAERVLWNHVDAGDWEQTRDACLGLLHLPCDDLRADIERALTRHRNAVNFPEFLPVLAGKTGDPAWLGRLVDWGARASVDCNGGLILGIALHGDEARADFVRLLWDPDWEAADSGTGANLWAYAGARVLGLRMADLYADFRSRLTDDRSAPKHCVEVIHQLVHHWAWRPWLGIRAASDPAESYEDMYDLLCRWSDPNHDDSWTALVEEALGRGDLYLYEVRCTTTELRIRAANEVTARTSRVDLAVVAPD